MKIVEYIVIIYVFVLIFGGLISYFGKKFRYGDRKTMLTYVMDTDKGITNEYILDKLKGNIIDWNDWWTQRNGSKFTIFVKHRRLSAGQEHFLEDLGFIRGNNAFFIKLEDGLIPAQAAEKNRDEYRAGKREHYLTMEDELDIEQKREEKIVKQNRRII